MVALARFRASKAVSVRAVTLAVQDARTMRMARPRRKRGVRMRPIDEAGENR